MRPHDSLPHRRCGEGYARFPSTFLTNRKEIDMATIAAVDIGYRNTKDLTHDSN